MSAFFARLQYLLITLVMLITQLVTATPVQSGLAWEDEPITVYSDAGGVYYPRLCVLGDGSMLCAFSSRNVVRRLGIRVMRSTDGGLTWQTIAAQASQYPLYDCDNANLLQLNNGDILLAYRAVLTGTKELIG